MRHRDPIEVNFFVPLSLPTCEGLSWAVAGELLQILEGSFAPLYPDTMANYNNLWLQDESGRENLFLMNRLGGQISENENLWTLAYQDPRLAAEWLLRQEGSPAIPRRRTKQADMCFKISEWLLAAAPTLLEYQRGVVECAPDSYQSFLPIRALENFGNYDEQRIHQNLLPFIPETWLDVEPRWLNLLIESEKGPTGVVNMKLGEYQAIQDRTSEIRFRGTPLSSRLNFREDGFPGATLGKRIFVEQESSIFEYEFPLNQADFQARHLRRNGHKIELSPMLTCPNVEKEWMNVPEEKFDPFADNDSQSGDFEIIAERMRKSPPNNSHIVPGSLPILSFGDHRTARVATIGLNPSDKEFLGDNGWLTEEKRRVPSLVSLGVESGSDLTDEYVYAAYEEQLDYFTKNPLKTWFNAQNKVLTEALSVDYFDGSACHLDLVQWATSLKQSDLSEEIWNSLVESDQHFLKWQLDTTSAEIIVMISRGTVNALTDAGIAPELTEQKLVVPGVSQSMTFYFGKSQGKVWLGWNRPLYKAVSPELVQMLIETIREKVRD